MKFLRRRERCKVEFTEHGLEITGPCAKGLSKVFGTIFQASKKVKAETTAFACISPKTGAVGKIVLGKFGTPTSSSLQHGRICPRNNQQISMHTHPTSGIPKFSDTDAITISSRMNESIDDGSCVVGEDATQCFLKTLTTKKRKPLNNVI